MAWFQSRQLGMSAFMLAWCTYAWAAQAPDIDLDKIILPDDMVGTTGKRPPSSIENNSTSTTGTPTKKNSDAVTIDIDKLPLPADMLEPVPGNSAGKSAVPYTPVPKTKWNWGSLNGGGYLKNETAYRFDSPRTFTKIRNILYLNGQYTYGTWFKYNFAGWTYRDVAYDLFEYQTITGRQRRDAAEPLVFHENLPEEKDSPVTAVRESYIDFYFKNMDARIGKQYIIWGVLEGVRVVDEINPMDFRELILPELLDYRVSQWSVKTDFYSRFGDLELVFIPDLQFHKPAPGGSEWELFQVLPETTRPRSWDPNTAEYGARFSKKIFGTDFTFSYWNGWDLYPTVFRLISTADITNAPAGSNIPIYPTYTRIRMYGLTFSRELEGNILKGEFAYVKDKYFAIVDIDANHDFYLDHDGEVKRDHIRWGLGYDFNLWGADFSAALTQWVIADYNRSILQDEVDTAFNIFIRKPLQKRSAVFTLLMIKLINFNETLIKPKVSFELTDHFQLATGVDWFIGEPTQFGRRFDTSAPGNLVDVAQAAQFLGNFRDNRRVFVDFKYSF